MKKILFILAVFVAVVSATDLLNLRPVNNSETFIWQNPTFLPVSSHGDTIVTVGLTDSESSTSGAWFVFRETSAGYRKVAVGPGFGTTLSPYMAFNNGKWMGGWHSGGVTLFELDANDNVVRNSTFNTPLDYAPALLSDNTLVHFDTSNSSFGSVGLNEMDLTWSQGPGFVAESIVLNGFPFNSYVISDDYIIWLNSSSYVFFYARQQDGSWKQTDGFNFISPIDGNNKPFNLYYNGVDTLIFSYSTIFYQGSSSSGVLVFVSKVNNTWQAPQLLTAAQFGLTESNPSLGYASFAALNADTLVFGVPYQGEGTPAKRGTVTISTAIGRAVVVQRRNNVWTYVAKISTPDIGILANSMAVSNDNLILTLLTTSGNFFGNQFYIVPLCFAQPINVTCLNQQVSSCQVDVSSTDSYAINNQCNGYTANASITGFSVKDYSLSVTFEFNRALSPSVMCTSILSCPLPPTTTTTNAPTAKTVSVANIATGTWISIVGLLATTF